VARRASRQRLVHEIFAGFWPSAPAELDFTRLLNRIPKYVATRTLEGPLAWESSTVLEGELAQHSERSKWAEEAD
jgi:hypothetical protein